MNKYSQLKRDENFFYVVLFSKLLLLCEFDALYGDIVRVFGVWSGNLVLEAGIKHLRWESGTWGEY